MVKGDLHAQTLLMLQLIQNLVVVHLLISKIIN